MLIVPSSLISSSVRNPSAANAEVANKVDNARVAANTIDFFMILFSSFHDIYLVCRQYIIRNSPCGFLLMYGMCHIVLRNLPCSSKLEPSVFCKTALLYVNNILIH